MVQATLKHVERASCGTAEFPRDVRVDHRRLDVCVAEVFPVLPDVDTAQEQAGCETVAQRVDGHRLVDPGPCRPSPRSLAGQSAR
jgi:hypothetical protein